LPAPVPLPRGWEEAQDYDGKVFYVDHNTQRTSWVDPRDKLTKPLTFSDCIGDELPYGWEQAFDDQVGVYYMDHINKLTQIEDPRAQWCAEQDRMLKEYLVVARDALDSRQEILQVKQQRLAFAQEEFRQLTAWSDKCGSQTSLHSGSSTSSKYDPEILKADIAEMKARVSFPYLYRCVISHAIEILIDRKMGNGLQGGYQLDEAQAILQELKSIHKAISSGEKEKRQIMQNLAQLKDGFQMNDRHMKLSESHLSLNHLNLSLSRPCLDTGSQTEITGDVSSSFSKYFLNLVCISRLANIQIELAKLEAEACPGAIEAERDRLLLMHEKEELLRDLCQSRLHKQLPDETQQCKVERRRLEEELHQALTANSEALTRRLQLQGKRNSLLRQLEEATRQASYLHSQLKSVQISLTNLMARLDNTPRHWYNLLNLHHVQEQEPQISTILASHSNRQPVVKVSADKETNTDIRMLDLLVTRPKELCTSFKRANAIVRSQTFSSSARNQYVCRLNRSDSDSSPVLQASMKAGRSAHTSLDLELDLQASKAAEERLNDELRSLRELQSRLEYARERDCAHLPTWIREDVRFQHLLEKQRVERMLKKASKEIFRLRGQSQKVPPQVQFFRYVHKKQT
uniref:WW domain-containing protein n=1 Tax=Eptatretus burgeri TaxID=7764 RepID=A0A8C4QRD8_EPTBU